MSIFKMLEDLIIAERAVLDGAAPGETDRRVSALRELRRADPTDPAGRFAEAMTTAHFSTYFTDALSRMFYKAYNMKSGSWRAYTYADEAPDFRDVKRFRMSNPGTLLRRREKAEAKATYVAASKVEYGVEEFGRQFDVSWQTILNDDLGEIQETPMRMAQAALRFEDSFVSALYDNATSQAGLIALGAAYAGTGRLTAANLAIGINAMTNRTDAAGEPIQINRLHLVIPAVLQIQAATVLESILMAGVATNDKNVLPRFINGVHVDPYIAFAGANIPWYLFADPSEIPAVTVARLRGVPGPWVYKKASDVEMISGSAPSQFTMGSFATGDIEYGVGDIIGGWDDTTYVGITDFHGIYYSSGTTP
jgi:hypothetical protein